MRRGGIWILPIALLGILWLLGRQYDHRDREGSGPSSAVGGSEHELARADAGTIIDKASDAQPREEETLALSNRLVSLAGEVDVANRYRAAVMITAQYSRGELGGCSGVVIGPQIVLTAGHCVCGAEERFSNTGEPQQIEARHCADGALVETASYGAPKGSAKSVSSTREVFDGRVQPHPDLRILIDEGGRVVSSVADLAIILLDRPIGKEVQPISLADKGVQVGEFITIVGYGYDELADVYGSERRYSRNKVVEFPALGGTTGLIEQPGGHVYKQDSGGPCLRENGKETALVGISSRNLGAGASFTSIHGYREWVLRAVERASRSGK